MSYDPQGPVAKQLEPLLINELTNRYNISDDAPDVAEFINMLIANGKSAADISQQVKEIVDIPIDEAFVSSVFQEIQRIMAVQAAGEPKPETAAAPTAPASAPATNPAPFTVQLAFSTQLAFPAQPSGQMNIDFTQPVEPKVAFEQAPTTQVSEPNVAFSNIPSKPRGQRDYDSRNRDFESHRGGRGGRGGISKGSNPRNGKKSYGLQNSENFEKAMNMAGGNTNIQPSARVPKGRCPDFPYCRKGRQCPLAHPARECYAYPNCPNPPGTCNYLHPSEDGELMAKLEKSRAEFEEKRKQREPREAAGTLGICKFGMLCSKDICPFGHPTPSNKDARVIVLEWCVDGKQCSNTDCKKAHPSPNYQAPPPEPKAPPARLVVERVLEQCRFGLGCTKFNCPRRHALSPVPCRQGAECTRIDCSFAHPLDMDCRFGQQCLNRNCMYRHPEGRAAPTNTWVKDQGTNQRAFAVPDDQVMEHASQA